MIPTIKEYGVFEANQVLTASQLNNQKDYLDEQNRLTRATIHGIGVVCGLEIGVNKPGGAAKLIISKGCGITSEGYLAVVGNRDFIADKYLDYTINDDYSLLSINHTNKYPLWELLDDAHDAYDKGHAITPAFLEKKVVLLYVELLEKDMNACSAASCDGTGLSIQVTLRKLLIEESDLEKLHAEIEKNTEAENAHGDFTPDMASRLELADLKLPRFDVPSPKNMEASSIFDAYREILLPSPSSFEDNKSLFEVVGDTLDKCYNAFKPILPESTWSFTDKLKRIKKTYKSIQADERVIFSQYFYDFLGDLIEAYEEFRWKALDFMSLCNPPQTLFPRHLELGKAAKGDSPEQKKAYRHIFRPSPALSTGASSGEEVRQLFKRLRLLVEQFLKNIPEESRSVKSSIKVTPSRSGNAVLSDKAIPFYYVISRNLLGAWNYTKTKRGRADQNLGYHVNGSTDALLYDLEHYNFFRIEGHIGSDWRNTMKSLLTSIRNYRLPFDVVALNAHPSTVSSDVLDDPLLSHCLTNDLEIIYDAWAKELECLIRDKINKLTDFRLRSPKESETVVVSKISPSTSGVKKNVRKVSVEDAIVTGDGTFGNILADSMRSKKGSSTLTLKESFRTSVLKDVPELNDLSLHEFDLAIGNRLEIVTAMMDFTNTLPDSASLIKYDAVRDKYDVMANAVKHYRAGLSEYKPSGEKPVLTEAQKEATQRELEEVLKNCLMARLQTLHEELEERKKKVDELVFFNKYVRKHPGITHKAGVPSGGTFILVFQETPSKSGKYPTKTRDSYSIPERVVIADFFLPYRSSSDCAPLQFVMPAARPVFSMSHDCPDENGIARVDLDFSYRVPPCEVKIDDRDYVPLVDDRITLAVGTHVVTVRDAEGGVSLAQSIEVSPGLTVEPEDPVCDEQNNYSVKIKVQNARLPITLNGEEVEAKEEGPNRYTVTTGKFQSGRTVRVSVGDASDCPEKELTFSHTCCDLPCQGIALRRGYRLLTPERSRSQQRDLHVHFWIEYPKGEKLDLSDEAKKILIEGHDVFNEINSLIDRKTGVDGWMQFHQEPRPNMVAKVKTLWIEYFECLEKQFSFNFIWSTVVARRHKTAVSISISPNKSVIRIETGDESRRTVAIPAFDGLRIDKCVPDSPEEMLCKKPHLSLAVLKPKIEGNTVSLSVKQSGTDRAVAFLWELPRSVEKIGNGKTARFTFTGVPDGQIRFRVTAFTRGGCRVIKDGRFTFDNTQ